MSVIRGVCAQPHEAGRTGHVRNEDTNTLEGRENAKAGQTELGWARSRQALKPGPVPGAWAELVPSAGPNSILEPHSRLAPEADPQAFASSPPCQVKPAFRKPPAALVPAGDGENGERVAYPSMCQLPAVASSNYLSAWSQGAGEIKWGAPERAA